MWADVLRMGEQRAGMSGGRLGSRAALLLVVLATAACQFGSVGGDVRGAADRMQCEANLRRLYVGLENYISVYGDLPRGKNGLVSIEILDDPRVRRELGIEFSELRCPADKNPENPSYVLNPALSIQDLGPQSATVIACERIPCHAGVKHSIRAVLIGDGSTVMMDLPKKEQDVWYRLFSSGNRRACIVTPKDGVKGNWTSCNIIWCLADDDERVSKNDVSAAEEDGD